MAQTVARNRQDLERALSTITSELLKEKGYLCFVDVFIFTTRHFSNVEVFT